MGTAVTVPRPTSEAWAGGWLILVALCLPLVGVAVPLGIAGVQAVLALLLMPFVWRRAGWRGLSPLPVVLLAALAAWGLASAPWAIDPGQAATGALRFLAQAVLGLIVLVAAMSVSDPWARRIGFALLLGLAAAFAVHGIDVAAGYPLGLALNDSLGSDPGAYTKRGLTIIALLIWPLRLLLRDRLPHRVLTAITVAMVVLILLDDSLASSVSLLAGVAVAFVVRLTRRRAPTALTALVVIATLGLPPAAALLPPAEETFQRWSGLSNSAHHRLTIWHFVGERIAEKPLPGWGMNASRDMPGADREIVVRRYDAEGRLVGELSEAQLPLHPHNAVLQIWLELGLPGALVLMTLAAWMFRRTEEAEAGRRADLAALVAGTLVMAMTTYGLWQSWWQAALWLVAAFALCGSRAERRAP